MERYEEIRARCEAADVVLFLPDYPDSKGAMLEWPWCQRVGKQTAYCLDWLGGGQR